MAGYNDTKAMIISTLMGRPAGTEIQPENQQAYELNMLDYIRSLELISSSPIIGVADETTTPVQPDNARVSYIAGVAQNRTVTFQNFIGENGQPLSITTGDMEAYLVILLWNAQYWTMQAIPTNIVSSSDVAYFYYSYNIRKTYASVAAMNADSVNPIGIDGKPIKLGDMVSVVNSSNSSENGFYSRIEDGWQFQSSFNFQVEQTRSQNVNTAPSSKLFDDQLDILQQLIDTISSYVILKDVKNILSGCGTPSPKYLFQNISQGANNPKVENIVDTESPFKDILGYLTKISNSSATSATMFLMSTSDYITSRPKTIKLSFFTKNSDWDNINNSFLFGWGFYSYSPSVISNEIKFNIHNILNGVIIDNSDSIGTLFDGKYSLKKTFEKDGFSQILLEINVTNWKLSSGAGFRPMVQLSDQQPYWANESFVMVNQQITLDNILESGIFVYPDINNIVDFYYPEPLLNLINKNSENIVKLGEDVEEQIQELINGTSQVNQIGSIGTANPSMAFLQNAPEASVPGGYPKVENIVDTESPFKDILGYLTKFTNTQTASVSNFRFEATEVRTNRPTLISMSFWVKKSQFTGKAFEQSILIASYTNSPVLLLISNVGISTAVDGVIGNKITANLTAANFLTTTREYYKAFESGDWCQIIVNYKNIVWLAAEGTKWKYGLGFNSQQTKWVNQSLDYANFQISENLEVPIGVFVIKDVFNSVLPYPPSMSSLGEVINKNSENIQKIEEQIQGLSKKTNKFVYDATPNAYSYIESPFNDDYNIRINFIVKRPYALQYNPCFNFASVQLINKSTQAVQTVHSNGDDITPSNFNDTYIGANHGCSDLRAVTAAAHGKTFADIGSEWTNGTYKFYIIGIIDSNTLWVLGENSKTYPFWSFRAVVAGDTLTHVSGATNTGSISVSASTMNQFYPSIAISSLKLIADGVEINESGTYYFDELNICENYDIFNVASTLDKIRAKVGTFTANPVYNQLGADKVARHSLDYKFTSANKCFVNTNFIAYQNLQIGYFGFIQQQPLNGNIKMYIPKALPIMDGTNQKDFRTIVDYNSVGNIMNLTTAYWENPSLPPDRYIQASDNIVFNGGFLFDYGVGGNKRKDFINNSFFLYTSRKIYPHGIDSKITVNAGSVYNAVCFRVYSDVNNFNKNGVINQNVFEYEDNLYVYVDFNSPGIFEIDIPDKFVGRSLNIFEKSENVNVLSETSNAKILINVSSANPMYGYVVMKI